MWAVRFRHRHHLTLRAITHCRPLQIERRMEILAKWHKGLREFLSTRMNSVDGKWGRFLPLDRYNVDQVPLPFVVSSKYTWDTKGSQKRTSVTTHDSKSEKRFATLQLCISPAGVPLLPTIIFRGTYNY